jgi:hypothetical protein
MRPFLTRNLSRSRALAAIFLACLVALGPALFAHGERGFAEQAGLSAGWTICTSDSRATGAPDTGGLPANHVHPHCALCAALPAPIEPPPGTACQPALYRVVANPARAGPVLSLKRAGWSTSWSSRAPPFDA